MKKIFMTLAAVAVAATMNAQVYVGGSLGISGGKTTQEVPVNGVNVSTDVNKFNFEILPEIGYKISDNMAVGAEIGVKYVKSTNPESFNNVSYDVTSRGFTFKFSPYFRYYFAQWDKVGLFFDAQLGLAFGSTKSEDFYYSNNAIYWYDRKSKNTEISFAIVPGVSYQASEKISVVAKLGNGLGYWFNKTTTPHYSNAYGVTYDSTDRVNTFGLNLKTIGLTVGVYYNF